MSNNSRRRKRRKLEKTAVKLLLKTQNIPSSIGTIQPAQSLAAFPFPKSNIASMKNPISEKTWRKAFFIKPFSNLLLMLGMCSIIWGLFAYCHQDQEITHFAYASTYAATKSIGFIMDGQFTTKGRGFYVGKKNKSLRSF